jgi:hypothetical protein
MKRDAILKWVVPSLPDVLLIAIFLSVFTAIANADFWWHLTLGREIVRLGSIPDINAFYYTPASSYGYDYSWLSQLMFYGLYSKFGWGALVFLKSLVAVFTFFVLWKMLEWRQVNVFWALLVLGLAFWASLPFWVMRPLIFTWLLFTCLLYILDSFSSRHRDLLWLIPVIMVFWVNLHPGFLAGLGLLVIYTLFAVKTQKFRKLLVITITTFVACAINPFGLKIWLLPWNLVRLIAVLTDHITEWQPRIAAVVIPYGIIVALLIVSLNLGRKRLNSRSLIMFVVMLIASLAMIRNVPLFAVVSVLAFGEISALISRGKTRNFMDRVTNTSLQCKGHLMAIAVLAVLGIGSIGAQSDVRSHGVELKDYPVEAIKQIREAITPREICTQEVWSGYLLWNLYPQRKSFFDAKGTYGREITEDCRKLRRGYPKWEEVVDKHGINCILWPSSKALTTVLGLHEDWRCMYSDSIATIFVRNGDD